MVFNRQRRLYLVRCDAPKRPMLSPLMLHDGDIATPDPPFKMAGAQAPL
jgi:hypothetical protein